jgi:hypothetical protein
MHPTESERQCDQLGVTMALFGILQVLQPILQVLRPSLQELQPISYRPCGNSNLDYIQALSDISELRLAFRKIPEYIRFCDTSVIGQAKPSQTVHLNWEG